MNLKARGYHIVHGRAGDGGKRPATRRNRGNGGRIPKMCDRAVAKIRISFLPSRRASSTVSVRFDLLDAQPIALAGPFDRSKSPDQGVALPRETPWPQHSELPL